MWLWAPIARAASIPVLPGMRISRKVRSGFSSATSSIASSPFLASPTISSSGHTWFRRMRNWSRISLSSSAMIAVGMVNTGKSKSANYSMNRRFNQSIPWPARASFRQLVGHLDGGDHAAWRIRRDVQLAGVAVQQLEALADGRQAEAGAVAGHHAEADAVVGDRHAPLVVRDLGHDLQAAALGLAFEAVLDRVLDHRLQHHRREGRAAQAVGDLQVDRQALFHAHLEQVQVSLDHVHFAPEVG